MKRDVLVVGMAGWALLGLSLLDIVQRVARSSYAEGFVLPASEAAPYGIMAGLGLTVAGRVLARLERDAAKRE